MVKVTVPPAPLNAGVKLYAWPTVTLLRGAPDRDSVVLLFEVCIGADATDEVDTGTEAVAAEVPVEPPPPQPASALNMSAAQNAVRIDTARMT